MPRRALTDRNVEVCRRAGFNSDAARCDWALGRLALAAGDPANAIPCFAEASRCFRDSDYLTDLAETLPDLAVSALGTGDAEAADRHATEAIAVAAPRSLIPAQCAALTARARVRAAQAAITGPDPLFQGRDAADAALRLATRHHLTWHELDALYAHTALDRAEGTDRGWAAKAGALRARLILPGLDRDPLFTVEKGRRLRKAWRG